MERTPSTSGSSGPKLAPLLPTVSPPTTHPATRSQTRRIQAKFRLNHDALPDAAPSLPSTAENPQPAHRRQRLKPFKTEPDMFGRFRIYAARPLTIPDSIPRSSRATTSLKLQANTHSSSLRSIHEIISPCPNLSAYYMQRHHWLNHGRKSLNSREELRDFLLQPGFRPSDLAGVNVRALDDKLANASTVFDDPSHPVCDGWRSSTIYLQIPPRGKAQAAHLKSHPELIPGRQIPIPSFHSRKILNMIHNQFSCNDIGTFHYEPFESYWSPPTTAPGSSTATQRLSEEIFTSPAMIQAH